METTDTVMTPWNQYMFYGIIASLAASVLILLYYEFRVFAIKDHKEKYDFVNQNEIRYFWFTVIALLISGAFAINTLAGKIIQENGVKWVYVRAFISLSFIVIGYFALHSLIKIYYPKKLSNRLNKLRTAPRISPAGNVMRRLTEVEEDVHMERSMIEEEEIQAVDYDVWIDDSTGYKKIEKYVINEQTAECPECGFYTLSIASEEVGKKPTETEEGTVIEHLQCSYCSYREKREVTVSKLSENVV